MPYNVPTLKQLINSGVLDIEASIDTLLPKFSVERAVNTAFSSAVRDLYDFQSWIVRQIIPTSESEDQTILDIARSEGVVQKLAEAATGNVRFKGSTPLPVNSEMSHSDGRVYLVTSSQEPVNGEVITQVVAQEVGIAGNMALGETLTLISAVPGVESKGISNDISGGANLEPISEVLERLLYRKRNPPMGGAPHDYVAWCREVAGVTRAWCVDRYQGGSTVGYAFVFDNRDDILPTTTDYQNMADYIYRHKDPATNNDVGAPAGIEPVKMHISLLTTNMTIRLIPDTSENRTAVEKSLKGLFKTLSPGDTLLISSVRTAIGSQSDVQDYTLDLNADIPSSSEQLHHLGVISWGEE